MEKFTKFENKIFTGFLSKDPEIRYLDSGACVAKISIPQQENKESETLWLNGEAWDDKAEKIAELKKGNKLTIAGNFKKETYNEKEYLKFVVSAVL